MPINIDFLANATSLLRGTSDVEAALEAVADSLDDVAAESQRSTDKMADNLKGAAREGEQANERLERSFKELSDVQAREARAGAQASTRASDEARRSSGENISELKNEARQNLAETLSSFDGSAQSFGDLLTGTLGGVVAGLNGVLPILAAVAGAAGIGLVISQFQKGEKEAEEYKAKVAELTTEFLDLADNSSPAIEQVVSKLKQLVTASGEGVVTLKDLRDAADGEGFKELAELYAGNSEGLGRLIKKSREYEDQLRRESQEELLGANRSDVIKAIDAKIEKREKYNQYLTDQQKLIRDAEQQERSYLEAGGPALEAKANLLGAINDRYDEGAGAIEDYLNKEKTVFDVEAYVKAMRRRQEALRDFQEDLTRAELSSEAKAFLVEQGAETAAIMLQGYKKASPKTKKELNRIWSEAGDENSGEYVKSFQGGIDRAKIKVKPAVDLTDADQAINRWAARTETKRITVDLYTRNGRRFE